MDNSVCLILISVVQDTPPPKVGNRICLDKRKMESSFLSY